MRKIVWDYRPFSPIFFTTITVKPISRTWIELLTQRSSVRLKVLCFCCKIPLKQFQSAGLIDRKGVVYV
jgi:hypothetical protein